MFEIAQETLWIGTVLKDTAVIMTEDECTNPMFGHAMITCNEIQRYRYNEHAVPRIHLKERDKHNGKSLL